SEPAGQPTWQPPLRWPHPRRAISCASSWAPCAVAKIRSGAAAAPGGQKRIQSAARVAELQYPAESPGRRPDAPNSAKQKRQMSLADSFKQTVRPIAKRLVFRTVQDAGRAKPLFRAAGEFGYYARETFEWLRRSLIATPVFLAQCAKHGENVSVDRVP